MIITYNNFLLQEKNKKKQFCFWLYSFFPSFRYYSDAWIGQRTFNCAWAGYSGAGPSASRCVSLFYRFLSRPSFHSFLSVSLSLPFSLFPCVSPFLHCNDATGVAPPNQYRTTHPRQNTPKNLIFFLRTIFQFTYCVKIETILKSLNKIERKWSMGGATWWFDVNVTIESSNVMVSSLRDWVVPRRPSIISQNKERKKI